MLATNHICQVQSQNFKLMQLEYMKNNLTGDNVSVLLPLRQMFLGNTDMTYAFACEAYKLFIQQGKCKEYNFTDNYEQLATYGIALSNIFLSYNLDKGTLNLYTSSISVLKQLMSNALLKGKKNPIILELQNIESILTESGRIKTSIKRGNNLLCVRLDPEIIDGTVVFTCVIPRSNLDLDKEVIIPFQAMNTAMTYINEILQKKILKFTMGNKVRVVTKNYQVLSMIYGEERAKFLVSTSFDPRVESFYLPSVGASIYTTGVTNIKLVNVDKIEVINTLDSIDLSETKVDYTMCKEFFSNTIKKLHVNDLDKVIELVPIEGFNLNKDEKVQALNNSITHIYDRDLYSIMKKLPTIFNLPAYGVYKNKYGSLCDQVEIPKTKKDLECLLRTGIFKIVIKTRKGSLSTMICTNSNSELLRIYGSDFYKVYESEGVRLKWLENELKSKYANGISMDDFTNICLKYGLQNIFTELTFSNDVNSFYSLDLVLKYIRKSQYDIENRKTVVKQPHLVSVRSCEARVNEDNCVINYYKNLDLRCIISIVRLSNINEVKES